MKKASLLIALLLAGCGKEDSSSSPGSTSSTSSTSGSSSTPATDRKDASPRPKRDPPVQRPPLVRKQGKYFAWSMPAGWQFNETANGVDIFAPDQTAGAGVSVVFNYPGHATPRQIIDKCDELAGITDPKTLREENLDDLAGYGGIPWKVVERDYKFTYNGVKAQRRSTAAVQSYGNGFHAALAYFACEAKHWKDKSTWLVAIVNSVVVTNPRQLANLDKVSLPKNNPMDHEALSGYWREKGLSEDRIYQGQREGMMGYEEMESPTTGTTYQMPLETYDATKGGYHNPDNYDEILEKPQ